MKTRTTVLVLVTLAIGATLCFAADPNIGTWKLNEAKSKIDAGMPKNLTVVYEVAGDKIKATVDGVDGQGKPTHNEWVGKFDGKDYPLVGDPSANTRALKKIDDRNLELTNKKDGQITITGRIVVAKDGKSRTLTASGMFDGKKVEMVSVYDKQ